MSSPSGVSRLGLYSRIDWSSYFANLLRFSWLGDGVKKELVNEEACETSILIERKWTELRKFGSLIILIGNCGIVLVGLVFIRFFFSPSLFHFQTSFWIVWLQWKWRELNTEWFDQEYWWSRSRILIERWWTEFRKVKLFW